MTEFIIKNFDKWCTQNNAECIDCVEGCLLHNLVLSCKNGECFIFEEYVNCWTSRYHAYFFRYKEIETEKAVYEKLWNRFDSLKQEEAV